MSYTILTWDDKAYPIDDKNGERLIEAWTNSDKQFPVNLGGAAISSSHIKSITKDQVTESDYAHRIENSRHLKADNRNREDQYKAARQASEIVRENLKKKGILK